MLRVHKLYEAVDVFVATEANDRPPVVSAAPVFRSKNSNYKFQ